MTRRLRASLTVLGLFGCGGSAKLSESEAAMDTAGNERAAPRAEGELAVTGLRGTLSQSEIQNALEPRMPKFSACMQRRFGEVEWLSGKLEFTFHIAVDGSVSSVFPSDSSMGDRDTERCMLEVAKAVRFPEPHGGEADFSWPLEVPLDPEIRAPVALEADQVSEVLLNNAQATLDACGGGAFSITAYVDTEGKVVAVGASIADLASEAKLDCITAAIKGWAFPSPGSYPAKIRFGLR